MQDLIFVAVMLAFFATCVGLVRACEWIIGPDLEMAPVAPAEDTAEAEAAA